MVAVRHMTDEDEAGVIALLRRIFPNDPPHNEPSRMLAEKRRVDDLVFVAETAGQLIGACMAGYDGHRGWLYSVAVSPDHRRTGAGTELVKFAIATLRKRGCQKVNLQIRAENAAVHAFYQSLGFAVEDRLSMGQRFDSQ